VRLRISPETRLGSPLRNLFGGILYMAIVAASATVAYAAAGWSIGDALYMTILTVYTVGYEEVRPIDTPLLRGITMALIVLGCTGMIFLTGVLVQLITATQLQQMLGLKRMNSAIDRLSGHVIICGFGRIGTMLARELTAGHAGFVVLDQNEERLAEARARGYLCIAADATDETALRLAGVERARSLATVLPDDAANVFITLSARSLNRTLTIVARGEVPSTERKLLQAGADRVVLPAHIGAERIAEIILFPAATELLERIDTPGSDAAALRALGLEVEVVAIEPGSRAGGQTVRALEAEAAGAFMIVALDRQGRARVVRPEPETVVQPRDGVVLVGRPGRAQIVAALFQRG
jgi:trk system potassium uptake protein TrkA/voltage-gated potassium channel